MHDVTANGASIPALGFGVFRMSGTDVERMVPHALSVGFRHFDTAQITGTKPTSAKRSKRAAWPATRCF